MKSTALVSTITPCFHMERYLKGFLERLPEQTFFDQLEVVLDHNEPTEQEINWVREFQKQYPGIIRHIVRDKVDPIGVSMNRCIQEASAEYVTIWNVDDLRTPRSVETQARILLEKSETGFVYGNFWIVPQFGGTQGQYVDVTEVPATELSRGMIIGPFFMFRKSLCEQAGYFDEQLRSGADFDLAVRLALHSQGEVAAEDLGYYLNEGRGASTSPNSLQPIERTVIELRYGIYDKINYDYLPHAMRYNIHYLLQFGEWTPVSQFVPDDEAFMQNRSQSWFVPGMKNYVSMKNNFADVDPSVWRQLMNWGRRWVDILRYKFNQFIGSGSGS